MQYKFIKNIKYLNKNVIFLNTIFIDMNRRLNIMTNLNCSACTCAHNKDHLCILNNIEVAGEFASQSDSTCCNSFQEKTEGSFINSIEEPSISAEIGCKAEGCIHNENCMCCADEINISGDHASASKQTMCSTFQSK